MEETEYITVEIPKGFFCEDCKLRHKITEKAIIEMIQTSMEDNR